MYFLYVAEIYVLALLKISYEVITGLLFLSVLMASVRLILGDKYYFTKKIEKLRRYVHGKL